MKDLNKVADQGWIKRTVTIGKQSTITHYVRIQKYHKTWRSEIIQEDREFWSNPNNEKTE